MMPTQTDRPEHQTPNGARPTAVTTWGPLALVVVLLIVVGGIASIKGSPATTSTKAAATPTSNDIYSKANPKSWTKNPVLPVTYNDAKKAGTTSDYDWGAHCNTKTGRIAIPTVYAPPCTPIMGGTKPWRDQGGSTFTKNGGATSPGVTKDEITIVYYVPSPQDLFSVASALGVIDPPGVMYESAQKVVDAYNHMFNLYGRKVKLVKFQGSGDGINPTAARSDAIEVATKYHPFASLGGPTQTGAYGEELAKRGVVCIGCSLAVPDSTFQKNAPYMWGYLATPEQFVRSVFDFGIANLWGRPARFAGDPALRKKTRVVGVVHYEQNPPIFAGVEKATLTHYKKLGYSAKAVLTYILDTDTLNTQAQTIIGKLKADHVTTVVFLGDPLMLKALTEQATKQNYRPEWSITGTAFTDTTAGARLFDQSQWAHAYGISTLPARVKPELTDSWRLYKWYYGTDPVATKSQAVLGPQFSLLYLGLHMAGPHLDPYSFAGGMFNYPPSGGTILNPRISYGFHGQFPNADYVGVDDFTVVWWDAKVTGPDEQNTMGKGMWAYVNGGKRYLLGSKPPTVGDKVLFDPKIATTIYKTPPADSVIPTIAPWPDFPAAKGGN